MNYFKKSINFINTWYVYKKDKNILWIYNNIHNMGRTIKVDADLINVCNIVFDEKFQAFIKKWKQNLIMR